MKIRITFAKQGALRYTGHLDLHKIWERAMRRADLPLAYSQGFHPLPKIQLAAALPLGFSSRCELVDIKIEIEPEVSTLPEQIQAAVPAGLKILKVEEIDEKSPPLQTQVTSAEYEVTLFDEVDLPELARRLETTLEAASLPRERRGKAYDLRPLIEALALLPAPAEPVLWMQLAAREGATGRPEEVLDVLGIRYEGTRVERSRFLFKEAVASASVS
jgi:radical SAM-linked protein